MSHSFEAGGKGPGRGNSICGIVSFSSIDPHPTSKVWHSYRSPTNDIALPVLTGSASGRVT